MCCRAGRGAFHFNIIFRLETLNLGDSEFVLNISSKLSFNLILFILFFVFTETVIRNQRRSARSGDLRLLGSFLTDNQVLIWKFNRLDRNRDKLLVSSEFLTPPMKKYLGSVKRGRKCGKKLLNDCDLDKDRGLSMMEWTHCLRTSRRMPLQ